MLQALIASGFDAWSGVCTAASDWAPPEAAQREVCNHGYARGRCEHFPAGDSADAVRFSVLGEGLIYVFEKDHAPMEHGDIDSVSAAREPLASQARAFLESWRELLARTVG